MSQLSTRLRKIREKRGLTLVELASLCCTSRSNIACWENGSRFPKFDNLITLSLQLNVDLDYLCGLSNNLKYDMSSLNPNTVSKIDEIIKKDIQKKL